MLSALLLAACVGQAEAARVGFPVRLTDVVLPGSELEPVPATGRTEPVVLAITRAVAHGDGFRYDIEATGLTPGTHDLRKALRRKDGTPVGGLPALTLTVTSPLKPGQELPSTPSAEAVGATGGYKLALIAAGVAWFVGFLAILFVGRKHKAGRAAASAKPPSLADRLRPLVDRAIAGTADPAELAALERSLMTYWTDRLNLRECHPTRISDAIRAHAEAGPLVRQLEEWLHRPEPRRPDDPEALLRPYRDVAADALSPRGA